MTTTSAPQATVEVPWNLFSTLRALASDACDSPEFYEAHQIRDALALLHDELDQLEVETVRSWGMDLESRTAQAHEMVTELMERAGHR